MSLKINNVIFLAKEWPSTVEVPLSENAKILGVWHDGYSPYLEVLDSQDSPKGTRKITCVKPERELPPTGEYIGVFRSGNGYRFHVIEVKDKKEGE